MTSTTSVERPHGPLPRAFWALLVAALINRVGGFVVPFLALYLRGQRGLDLDAVGLVIALWGAGSVLSGPLGGLLADRFGRRRTIVLGLALSAASMLHLSIAIAPGHLAVAALVLGVCADLSRPAQSAAVADLVPAPDRARAYGYLYWAVNLGFALASVAAGFFARSRFGVLFVADAATSLAAAAWVLVAVPETRRATARGEGAARDLVAPFRDASFFAFFAATLLVALVFLQFHATMPLDLAAHGVTTERYGLLAGLNGALVVLLQPLAARWSRRVRPGVALAMGALCTGLGFGVFGVAHAVPGYALGVLVLTIGEVAMAPITPVVVASLAPEELRGGYQGAFQLAFSVPACLAPLFGSRILGALGSQALWGGCVILASFAAVLHLAIERHRTRRLLELAAEV